MVDNAKRTNYLFGVLFVLSLGGLAIYQYTQGQDRPPSVDENEPRIAARKRVRVIQTRTHATDAFTQGLELHGNRLLESTGLEGKSQLRELDPVTGVLRRSVDLPQRHFGEGMTLVGDEIYVLTWKDGVAAVYDSTTFEKKREYRYAGEGWGLCYDGRRLIMSDGSAFLTIRDPRTFESTGDLHVRVDGEPQEKLNELECVGDRIYANIWGSTQIVEIDSRSGDVTSLISTDGIIDESELEHADVLNGIAYDETTRQFLITGKLWPKLFVVEFVSAR